MKTLKSIQKNQAQLNSLLMEKWGYKKELEEGKGHDGSCEEAHPDDPSKKGHEDYMAKQNKEE